MSATPAMASGEEQQPDEGKGGFRLKEGGDRSHGAALSARLHVAANGDGQAESFNGQAANNKGRARRRGREKEDARRWRERIRPA